MEAEAGAPLPERFPSRPGQVFPMYHVFADVNEFRGGEVLPSRSNRPLAADGLVLRRGAATRILLANFTAERSRIGVDGLGRRRADPHRSTRRTPCRTPRRPVDSEPSPDRPTRPSAGDMTLALGPYALARLDTE